jgi:hypothetical protein
LKKINSWQDVLDIIQDEGFKVAEFSRKTGIDASRIHNWKAERGVPRFDDTVKLMRYFEHIQSQPTPVAGNEGLANKYIALLETQITHLTKVNEVMVTSLEVNLNTVASGIADISAYLLGDTDQTIRNQVAPGMEEGDRSIATKADELSKAQWKGRKVRQVGGAGGGNT